MNHSRFNRRRVLKGMAIAATAPCFIPSSALGNADSPPPSQRIAIGHIGVGNRGGELFRHLQQCKGAERRHCRCLEESSRGLRQNDQMQSARRLSRAVGSR